MRGLKLLALSRERELLQTKYDIFCVEKNQLETLNNVKYFLKF